MKILVKEPNKRIYEKDIEDTLENCQEIVGGYIEVVAPFENEVLLVCNEEGKLKDLTLNFVIGNDYIAGTCFFTAGDEEGNFRSLTEKEIEETRELFI